MNDDIEVQALGDLLHSLEKLDRPAQRRIVDYAVRWLRDHELRDYALVVRMIVVAAAWNRTMKR